MADLTQFRAAIRSLGANSLLAQGSAGNASIKQDGTLWITASGTWLRDLASWEDAFVPVNVEDARRRLSSGAQSVTAIHPVSGIRPSIETWMHAVIPHRVVIHLHAVNTVACAVRADGAAFAERMLSGLNWAWIPYTPSGRPLGRKIYCLPQPVPQIFVLANHGLVVAADNVDDAVALVAEIECRLRVEPRTIIPPLFPLLRARVGDTGFYPARNRVVHSLATDPVSLEVILEGALYPCHWAFAATHTALASGAESAAEAVERFRCLNGHTPSAILFPGEGVLLRRHAGAEVLEQISGLAEVARRLPEGVPVRYMSSSEIDGLAVELGLLPKALMVSAGESEMTL